MGLRSEIINANAVNVPSFFMRRVSNPSPKPSQNYHYHDCYELYFLHSGDRYYFIDDKTYHVAEGSVVFEPDELTVLINFAREYVAGMIMSCVRESFSSEVAARRMAMDSAGKNAKEMLDNLGLEYNRARQSAITQEITEIVAGSGN